MKRISGYLVPVTAGLIICVIVCSCQRLPPNDMARSFNRQNMNAGPEDKMETRYATIKRQKGYHYMKKYFAIENVNDDMGRPPQDTLEEKLIELQRLGGLQETGELDEPTARLMTLPRCGVATLVNVKVTAEDEINKRYNVAGGSYKWDKMDLTYKIKNYPTDTTLNSITPEEVDDAVMTALKLWSSATPLTFTRVPADSQADIVMIFGKGVHTKVSGDPAFDGPGGILAHAFTPHSGWGALNGDVHYDDDETFTHKKYFGRNLQYVTAHEVGHALGLDHSNVYGSLMWPWILGYIPGYQLPDDDIDGIQLIYGENPNPTYDDVTSPVAPTPAPVPAGPYCDVTFSDVAVIGGELFAFKNKIFWKFSLDGHLVNDQGGTVIQDFFTGVPAVVNGIYERWFDEKVVFVKGNNYWRLDDFIAENGYPKKLSGIGVPKNIDAAMHRASSGTTYFFKSKLAYEYDEYEGELKAGTPRPISEIFSGIPTGTIVTGAFTGVDGYGYLLSGQNYYIVNPNRESDGEINNFAQDFLRCPQ